MRPNIIIGTIHSVKGGQADIVILSPDTSQEAHLARSEGVHKEEEQARLFYVGMTRAKQGLYIARPRPPCRRGLPSFFCPGVWKI